MSWQVEMSKITCNESRSVLGGQLRSSDLYPSADISSTRRENNVALKGDEPPENYQLNLHLRSASCGFKGSFSSLFICENHKLYCSGSVATHSESSQMFSGKQKYSCLSLKPESCFPDARGLSLSSLWQQGWTLDHPSNTTPSMSRWW